MYVGGMISTALYDSPEFAEADPIVLDISA